MELHFALGKFVLGRGRILWGRQSCRYGPRIPEPLGRPGRGVARSSVDRLECGDRGVQSARLGKAAPHRHTHTHTLWVQQAVRSGRIDLRKVPGTQNPADLLTKHSATRDKLGYLVSLFGCRYLGGRSEAAPRLRKDVEGAKRTLATEGRDGQLLAVEDAGPDDEWSETVLPHLHYDPNRLNELYPSFLAADEGVNGDDELEAEDARDPILVRGMIVASEISEAMRTHGRVR